MPCPSQRAGAGVECTVPPRGVSAMESGGREAPMPPLTPTYKSRLKGAYAYVSSDNTRQGVRANALRGVVIVPG